MSWFDNSNHHRTTAIVDGVVVQEPAISDPIGSIAGSAYTPDASPLKINTFDFNEPEAHEKWSDAEALVKYNGNTGGSTPSWGMTF